jgi:hypothetical protein
MALHLRLALLFLVVVRWSNKLFVISFTFRIPFTTLDDY